MNKEILNLTLAGTITAVLTFGIAVIGCKEQPKVKPASVKKSAPKEKVYTGKIYEKIFAGCTSTDSESIVYRVYCDQTKGFILIWNRDMKIYESINPITGIASLKIEKDEFQENDYISFIKPKEGDSSRWKYRYYSVEGMKVWNKL
jgi:hypothetical protein